MTAAVQGDGYRPPDINVTDAIEFYDGLHSKPRPGYVMSVNGRVLVAKIFRRGGMVTIPDVHYRHDPEITDDSVSLDRRAVLVQAMWDYPASVRRDRRRLDDLESRVWELESILKSRNPVNSPISKIADIPDVSADASEATAREMAAAGVAREGFDPAKLKEEILATVKVHHKTVEKFIREAQEAHEAAAV